MPNFSELISRGASSGRAIMDADDTIDFGSLRRAMRNAGSDEDRAALLRGMVSSESKRIGANIDDEPATVSFVLQAIARMGVGRLPRPMRTTSTAISSASTSLSLTGSYKAGAIFIGIVQWTKPSTVQVNQSSYAHLCTLTVDGSNVQGGNGLLPVPLGGSSNACVFIGELDADGTTLGGTLSANFVTNDAGHISYGVFATLEDALDYVYLFLKGNAGK